MSRYVDPKANTYSLIEFQSKYGTEESCEHALFQLKWPDGFKCPKCGFCHCTVIGGRRLPLYQCPACRHQTSATAGTIMANSKLSLVKWFLALHFAATNKDGIYPSSWRCRSSLMQKAALYLPLQRAISVWEARSTAMHSGLTMRFPEITAAICRNIIPKAETDG